MTIQRYKLINRALLVALAFAVTLAARWLLDLRWWQAMNAAHLWVQP